MASKALPVGTCDESYLPRLVFQPPPGIRNDAHKDFHKMRLDKHHYQRSYMLCRGSGGSPKDCARRIAADTFITPQNPAIEAHKKELVDGIKSWRSSSPRPSALRSYFPRQTDCLSLLRRHGFCTPLFRTVGGPRSTIPSSHAVHERQSLYQR
eukprot:Selendium_serpulae@DN3461_c0_g1_i3.p1